MIDYVVDGNSQFVISMPKIELSTCRPNFLVRFQRVETGMNSPAMEKEGLKRSLEKLKSEGLNVNALVINQHVSVAKMMVDEYRNIRHYYDCWHVVKGVKKKLLAVCKDKANEDLTSEKVNSICNR